MRIGGGDYGLRGGVDDTDIVTLVVQPHVTDRQSSARGVHLEP